MGWGGGTSILDTVVEALLQEPFNKTAVVYNLLIELEDQDWDNLDESSYFNHPFVRPIIKELHPEWNLDEGEE